MKSTAVTAPLCLLGYGILRWVDGRNGRRHDGLAWTLGHSLFFLSIVLFAVLAVMLRRGAPGRRAIADPALYAVIVGAACFLWVISGDLFRTFGDRWPLPGALNFAGPMVFVLGMVTLLGLRVAVRELPWWSPALFFAGFIAISADLDLLPFAALAIGAAFVPVAVNSVAPARHREAETVH
jgi:hypothetical protein